MKWFQDRLPVPNNTGNSETKQVWYLWVQHDDTQSLLQEYAINRDDLLRSWAYIEDGVIYRGSTAWLMAIQNLRKPWCYLHYFLYVPLFIRETVYGYIARNRYRIFGKSEEGCKRPNKAMAQRMLHSQAVDEQEGEHDKAKSWIIPKEETRKRLLVVGCGPAGIMIAKRSRKVFDVLVVEPKDYYEFTPGILRGMCDPDELTRLHAPLRPVLVEQLGISLIQGIVTKLESRQATIQWQSPPLQQEEMDKLNRFLVNDSSSLSSSTSLQDPSVQEIEFDYCVVASGSAYVTSPLWKVFPDATVPKESKENHFLLSSRVAQMTAEHERLYKLNNEADKQHSIVIVGGGLVGVELAAELCIYYPNLCQAITIYDLAPTILAPFPQKSRDYATKWFTDKGVTITTNSSIDDIEAAKKTANVVYSCVGVKVTASSFLPASTIGERGEISVNEALQVVKANDDAVEAGLVDTSDTPTTPGIVAQPSTLFGSGRIFAIGDCVRVKGLPPFTKDTYPAEAMAGVVVANLMQSLNAHYLQLLSRKSSSTPR
ncbi:MAG: hypothetical protein SGARI_001234 [Bacillariaceae sp.]